DSGRVRGESDASDWLLDQLRHGLSRSELCVVVDAHRAWLASDLRRITALNDWMLATRESSELRRQTEQMGRSMLEWLRNGEPDPRLEALAALTPAPTFPIAFALASAHAGATPREAALSFGFGWAENMVQAAMKSVPLGQAAGQRILARLAGQLPECVDRALVTGDADRLAFLPMLAILSSQHEVQYSRLFRS
ncbi:MAG: urease accessory protein UreF, partial [Pseudomonadota bacterium]